MARPSPRDERRAERVRALQQATLELILEEGVEAFSMHRLAERVGLTAGALYRYFRSRDELLADVQLEVLDGFERFLDAALAARPTASPLERFAVLCHAYVALKAVEPERFGLIARLLATPRPLLDDDAALAAVERAMGLIAKLAAEIERAQAEGSLHLGEAGRRAIVAWSSLQAVLDREKLARLFPKQFEPRALVAELLRTLLLGWGASAALADDALRVGDEVGARLAREGRA